MQHAWTNRQIKHGIAYKQVTLVLDFLIVKVDNILRLSARAFAKMDLLTGVTRKVPSIVLTLLQLCLPAWFLCRLSYLTALLSPSSKSSCTTTTTSTDKTMEVFPERIDCLEPLKTLHETRANDQYGSLASSQTYLILT